MKIAAIFFLLILGLSYTPISAATAQAPDQILIDGQSFDLHVNILDPLIQSKQIEIPAGDSFFSGNWRGYLANWTVKNQALWLSQLRVYQDGRYQNVLSTVFPGKTKIKADWFSGTLFLGHGRPVIYRNMGYASEYANYTMLSIIKGTAISQKNLTLEQFQVLKKERFARYQQTAQYQKRYHEAIKKMSPITAEKFLFEYSVEDYLSD